MDSKKKTAEQRTQSEKVKESFNVAVSGILDSTISDWFEPIFATVKSARDQKTLVSAHSLDLILEPWQRDLSELSGALDRQSQKRIKELHAISVSVRNIVKHEVQKVLTGSDTEELDPETLDACSQLTLERMEKCGFKESSIAHFKTTYFEGFQKTTKERLNAGVNIVRDLFVNL